MKLSKFIACLKKLQKANGDLEVAIHDILGEYEPAAAELKDVVATAADRWTDRPGPLRIQMRIVVVCR